MLTQKLGFKDYGILKEIIENNGVIAFPTETVYGLGIRSDSFLAYTKLFDAKKRPSQKSLTLMLYDANDIKKYAHVDENAQKIIDNFMPGAITIILKKKTDVNLVGLDETVGIRIPDDIDTLALLKGIGLPMYVTSANISGEAPLEDFQGVFNVFDGVIEAIVEGESGHNLPSTVVSLIDNKIEVLRQGDITLEDIKGVIE